MPKRGHGHDPEHVAPSRQTEEMGFSAKRRGLGGCGNVGGLCTLERVLVPFRF